MANVLGGIPGLEEFLTNSMRHEAETAEKRARHIRLALDSLSRDPGKVMFEASLVSLWTNEGEQSVVAKSRKGVAHAILKAQATFRKINGRSDIQAKYSVRAYIGSNRRLLANFSIRIPEEFFVHLK